MRIRFPALTAALAVTALLQACTTNPAIPVASCHATGAVAELGKPLTPQTVDTARMGAGAVRTEVLALNAPPPRDVDPQRLKIEVDQNRVIQRMRCG
jgi:hypothetical protein